MKIRFDHIIVMLSAAIAMILIIYLMDSIFSSRYNKKIHKYDRSFDRIEANLKSGNFDDVIFESNIIVSECEHGTNDIKAKSYIAIAKIEVGKSNEAISILNMLIEKYPGIKMVYTDLLACDKSDSNLKYIFNNILSEYIHSNERAVNSNMSLMDIIRTMDNIRLLWFISILISSVVIYETIRNKRKKRKNIVP